LGGSGQQILPYRLAERVFGGARIELDLIVANVGQLRKYLLPSDEAIRDEIVKIFRTE
jgi:hypothetical protein